MSLDLVFSCLRGRSLSDSIFGDTFVSLFSPLPDSLLRVKIINPEVGDPLSGSGTDVQGAKSAHICVHVCAESDGVWKKQQLTTAVHTDWGDGLVTYALGRRDEPLTDCAKRLEVGFGIGGARQD